MRNININIDEDDDPTKTLAPESSTPMSIEDLRQKRSTQGRIIKIFLPNQLLQDY